MNIAYLPGRKAIRSGDYVVHAGIPSHHATATPRPFSLDHRRGDYLLSAPIADQ